MLLMLGWSDNFEVSAPTVEFVLILVMYFHTARSINNNPMEQAGNALLSRSDLIDISVLTEAPFALRNALFITRRHDGYFTSDETYFDRPTVFDLAHHWFPVALAIAALISRLL
jgi:hypothetical protein